MEKVEVKSIEDLVALLKGAKEGETVSLGDGIGAVLIASLGEQKPKEPSPAERLLSKLIEKAAERIRMKLLTDTVQNVHHLLHEGDVARAQDMLCIVNGMIEQDESVIELMPHLCEELDAVNTARAKHTCKGTA